MTAPLMQLPPSALVRKMLDLPDADIDALRQNLASNVSFGMNPAGKRIALSCAGMPLDQLSAKQRDAVIRIALRYRRQLSDQCWKIVGKVGI